MNKEIENQIASVIESALNLGGESKAFLYEQIPDLVNQLILWNITSGAITVFSCFIVLSLCFGSIYYIKNSGW